MAHYAFLDENNIVTEVIVGKDEDHIDWEQYYGDVRGQVCKRTSYNTFNGVHEGIQEGYKAPYRMNYAGIGYTFRDDINSPEGAFILPCPGEGYALDENTGIWIANS